MLRNAFNILESLTKIRIIVFRRVWVKDFIDKQQDLAGQGFRSL